MKFAIFTLFAVFSAQIQANQSYSNNIIKVMAIGSSPKGQFVAFEEFGYLNGSQTPFSSIRVKNLWKDIYVDRPIRVVSEDDGLGLDQVRAKAKKLAEESLRTFNIST